MQPQIDFKPIAQFKKELGQYANRMVYVTDYNVGMDRTHLLAVAKEIRDSDAIGWSAEMCLENLDDDEVLGALRDSRCKTIYCGLESIHPDELKAVNKNRTNTIGNY